MRLAMLMATPLIAFFAIALAIVAVYGVVVIAYILFGVIYALCIVGIPILLAAGIIWLLFQLVISLFD